MTIKIAVPNKGSLSDSAIAALRESGYRQRNDPRDLSLIDTENDVEFYYLRPRDIALYVGSGELDGGITGRDLLLDSSAAATEVLALDFGRSTFRFAAPDNLNLTMSGLSGKRIATAYQGLLQAFLDREGISAVVVALDGAVETSIKLGVADVIADVVSTGGTLRQAGLKVFGEPLLSSEAIFIEGSGAQRKPETETIIRRLQGVVLARQYVLVDYDVKTVDLEKACSLTPGLESPTISPLQKSDWNAVRAMVKRSDVNRIMDELWAVGARGILVTDIHACRL
jgi:ATP phosphoribosyltransferase